jgi:hypothetical protein
MIARLLWAAAFLTPVVVSAQERGTLPYPSSRSEFVAFLTSSDPSMRAGARRAAEDILTGRLRRAGVPVEGLAQDLVNLIVSDAPLTARLEGMTILIYAAQPERVGRYLSGFERLEEAYRRSNDIRLKSNAIGGIIEIVDEGEEPRALALLSPIASVFDPEFPTLQAQAINLIAQLNTAESIAFLRDLDEGGTVTDEWSSRMLRVVASNGYRTLRTRRQSGAPSDRGQTGSGLPEGVIEDGNAMPKAVRNAGTRITAPNRLGSCNAACGRYHHRL